MHMSSFITHRTAYLFSLLQLVRAPSAVQGLPSAVRDSPLLYRARFQFSSAANGGHPLSSYTTIQRATRALWPVGSRPLDLKNYENIV